MPKVGASSGRRRDNIVATPPVARSPTEPRPLAMPGALRKVPGLMALMAELVEAVLLQRRSEAVAGEPSETQPSRILTNRDFWKPQDEAAAAAGQNDFF